MNFLCKDTESCKEEKSSIFVVSSYKEGTLVLLFHNDTISNIYATNEGRLLEDWARVYATGNYTDLLHLGIEVSVAICNNELNCFIGYLFIRGFHGDAPDKIHPCQVKAFHALKSGNTIR